MEIPVNNGNSLIRSLCLPN